LITHGNNKVHSWGIGTGEFIPALGTQVLGGVIEALQHLGGVWIYRARGVAAGTVAAITAIADAIQDRLGKNAAARVASAQKKHVVNFFCHLATVNFDRCSRHG